MGPGNILVLHALQNMDGSVGVNRVAKKKMTAPLLDELSGTPAKLTPGAPPSTAHGHRGAAAAGFGSYRAIDRSYVREGAAVSLAFVLGHNRTKCFT
jgi:hypothetical protein